MLIWWGLPVCTLAKTMRGACPRQPTGQRMRDTWNRPGTHPQPESKPSQTYLTSKPPANLHKYDRINVVLSHWVGVGAMKHYWNNSWLTEQSDSRNMGKDYTNHTDANSSSNNLSPHQFPKNVFKNIWVAFLHLSPQALSSSKTWRQPLSNMSRKRLQI